MRVIGNLAPASAYLLAFLIPAALALAVTPLAAWLGKRWGWVALPGGRRQHPQPVPRIGGVGIFVAFLTVSAALFFFAPLDPAHRLPISGLLLGTAFAFAVGLADDWKELPAAPQFIGQLLTAGIALATTVWIQEVTLPFFGFRHFPWYVTYPLTILWITGMMNTVNFLDGLDGLAAGVAAIAALLFAAHMIKLDQAPIALYALAFAGACLGFLPFNMAPARIFLGSAGAMVLGYGLAALSILAPARIATALLVMAIPIADTAWQIVNRWRSGRSPFSGDRGHLHFRLQDLGWSQQRIVPLYWAFCALFGGLSLFFDSRWAKLIAFVALIAVVGGVLAALSRRNRAQ